MQIVAAITRLYPSQMQPAISAVIARLDKKCILQIAGATLGLHQKWILQIAAVIAILYWYHKCNLQIAAAIARLDEKCIVLPLLQDDTTNAYYKLLLLLQDYTKNAYCKLLFCKVLPSLRGVVKFAYWKLILIFKKYFEMQCHLNSKYSLLSARPFDKRTETASEQQYFQFLWYKILILI